MSKGLQNLTAAPRAPFPPWAQAAVRLVGMQRAARLARSRPQLRGKGARALGALQEPDYVPGPEPGTQAQPCRPAVPRELPEDERASPALAVATPTPPPAGPPRLCGSQLHKQTRRMLRRKATGALEPGLMRRNLEEELAPDGWWPRPGQTARRRVIHTQCRGTPSKLKAAAITGSRPLSEGGQQVKNDLQINILGHATKSPQLLAQPGWLSSSQGPGKKDVAISSHSGNTFRSGPGSRTPL